MAEAAQQRRAIDEVNARHRDQFRLLQGIEGPAPMLALSVGRFTVQNLLHRPGVYPPVRVAGDDEAAVLNIGKAVVRVAHLLKPLHGAYGPATLARVFGTKEPPEVGCFLWESI